MCALLPVVRSCDGVTTSGLGQPEARQPRIEIRPRQHRAHTKRLRKVSQDFALFIEVFGRPRFRGLQTLLNLMAQYRVRAQMCRNGLRRAAPDGP